MWIARYQKIYENVYVLLPNPGPRLQIPHVASISVINRHSQPITILNDEIYKYEESNLKFTVNTKEITSDLASGLKDVKNKIKKVLER